MSGIIEPRHYLLNDAEGVRQLTDYYVNRVLLMEHAREVVKRDGALLKYHGARQMNEEAMLLTALLKAEVQDRVRIDPARLRAYMEQTGADRGAAELELASAQRAELMDALIAKVRQGRNIEYLN